MKIHESGSQTPAISLEQLSAIIAAIHAAAAFPERCRDAVSAVAGLMNSLPERWHDAVSAMTGGMASSESAEPPARDWENASGLGEFGAGALPMGDEWDPSVQRVLGLLSPHLETARQVRMMLAEASRGRLALACLDQFAVAALVVDGARAVLHLNASARRLLVGNRFMTVEKLALRFIQPRLHASFEAALRRATHDAPCSSLLPIVSRGEVVYEVTVSPLEQAIGAPSPSNNAVPLAAVLIPTARLDGRSVAQRARQLYGLTEAEARVMAALTLGETVNDIAVEHGVRASTVRAQVRSIFEKTGVNRQSDLVRLALTGAPVVKLDD
jgi:DNA-binding NarL/FixJ family response regulator